MKTLRKILRNTYHCNKREFEPQVRTVEVMPGNWISQLFFFNINRGAEVAKTYGETVEIF